jgi:hypothetical protein
MEEIANERESETGLDSCGKIAARARILREDGHAGPAPAGEGPRHPQRNREILRDNTRFAPEGGTPLTVRGEEVWTDANPAPAHEHFIYLIYTPTMTNESTHVSSAVQTPRRNSRPTPAFLRRYVDTSKRRAVRITPSHSRARRYKEMVFRPDGEKSARASPTLPPKPTHKI